MNYNVLIVGAGKIGAFFDTPQSQKILTHAHAFHQHQGFNLLGFVDKNIRQAKKAALRWESKIFTSYSKIGKLFETNRIDVICVAVPDENHFEVLEKISHFPIKIVFVEKPLAKSLTEANKILNIYRKRNIPMQVNYSRRFVPEFEKLKEKLVKGIYGKFITGTGYYGKGFIHNGSHLIDLLRWYLGEIKDFILINKSFDFSKDDPSIGAVLNIKGEAPFFLSPINCNLFTLFEMDLIFEKRRIVIKNSGRYLEEYRIRNDEDYNNYKTIVKLKKIKTSSNQALFYAADNIYQFLTKKKKLKCSMEDGYQTLKICLNIKNSV